MIPAVFVSHGAPTLPFDAVPARAFLSTLGQALPRPKAILAISAHWETDGPALSVAIENETIHDFYGFPKPLYDVRYPAPGAPKLAAQLAERLDHAGLKAMLTERGLDHGAWVPLMLMYPQADIPVLQLSVSPHRGVAYHIALGKALQPFREDVLILASGGFVHNLRALDMRGGGEPDWSTRFAGYLDAAILERRTDDIIRYRENAPDAGRAHPRDEHILPLFVAYGAGETAKRLHRSATFGSLRMDAYSFE